MTEDELQIEMTPTHVRICWDCAHGYALGCSGGGIDTHNIAPQHLECQVCYRLRRTVNIARSRLPASALAKVIAGKPKPPPVPAKPPWWAPWRKWWDCSGIDGEEVRLSLMSDHIEDVARRAYCAGWTAKLEEIDG